MGLSCGCSDADFDPGDAFWTDMKDCAPLAASRAKRCWSCKDSIPVGALCSEIKRMKVPKTEVEEKIWG